MTNSQPTDTFMDPAGRRMLRLGYIILGILVLGIGGWAALTQIKGAVVATGVVVVENRPRDIQHLDGGIVAEIHVREGDVVAKGDELVSLDPTVVDANMQILRTRLAEAQTRIARLEAERDGLDAVVYPPLVTNSSAPEVQRAVLGQDRLFEARRAAADGEVDQLNQRILQANEQIRGNESRIIASQKQIRLVEDELTGLRELLRRGYVARTRVLALEREQSRLSGDIATARAEIARIRNLIGETRVQILQTEKNRRSEILTELREAAAAASEFEEQMNTLTAQGDRIDVRAPVAGRILNTQINTIGEVVAPGGLLMQVVPADERLVIEAQVDPADIDQVYPGQPTRVRLSAFNQRRTPELWAEVTATAPDRLVDEVSGLPYFNVRVAIRDDELARLPSTLEIRPGMPAEAFMQTESRSVLSYLVKPAEDAMSRAWREE